MNQLNASGLNIILTGFMGTGKSTVGTILAECLGRTCLDTDLLIEQKTGLTIAQIFEKYGEEHFRDEESRILLNLNKYPPGSLVVSTGGGIVLRAKNRNYLRPNGLIVLLTASPRAIQGRINKLSGRPLFQEIKTGEDITKMLARRRECYHDCDYIVDTTGKSCRQVAREIMLKLGLK